MKKLIGIGATIAALTYFLDPQKGSARRAQLQQRLPSFFRRRAQEVQGVAVFLFRHG